MRNTKKKILDRACELFNEQGYAQVTIRMIAQALGMSSGNLNYHFKKREDILEALYFEMTGVFDQRVAALPERHISFGQIKEDIRDSMEVMINYRFFWTDLHNLLAANDRIRTHFQEAYARRRGGYLFLFQQLQKNKWLRPPAFSTEHELLVEQMIHYSNTFLYASRLYGAQALDEAYIEQQSDVLLLLLYPYLTAAGRRLIVKEVSI